MATAGNNIYNQVAGGMTDAQKGIQNSMAYQPAQFSQDALNQYMNPFTSQVIDNSLANLETARQKAITGGQANAMSSGAYGGSRHGVADSLTNEAFGRQASDLASNLNMANYNQALNQFNTANQVGFQNAQNQLAGAGAMSQLANLGFGMGQNLDNQEYQRSLQDQMVQQNLVNQAKQMFSGFTNQGTQNLSTLLSTLGIVPSQGATTQSQQHGLFDYMTLLATSLGGLNRAGVNPFGFLK